MIDTLVPAMTEVCGADYVITDPAELRTYECDGLTSHRSVPGLVVLPETAEQVAGVVRACAAAAVPFVARGSGTGLSGGALAPVDGVLIVTSRMRKILEIDPHSRRAVVEPGVTNLAVSKAAEPFGYFYAPDPSSQVICSIGGNVAENSGGAHCLKHGFTVNHVTGLEVVTPDGEIVARRRYRGRPRLRPAGRVHRVRRNDGHRHQDHRPADQDPRRGDDAARRVRDDR